MNDTPEHTDTPSPEPEAQEVSRSRDDDFSVMVERLIRDAEDMRLSFMKRHRTRGNVTMTLGLISLTIGATGFGWFLFMEADILRAVGSMLLAVMIPALLQIWNNGILKDYERSYKREFLPRLAQALGGFKFHPSRGIGRKIIARTGLIPAHDIYEAEDCFLGHYKGVKVLFSEARLKTKKKYIAPVFDGVFVLLEIPNAAIEGHTILTADRNAYRMWRSSRWGKLQDVPISTGNKSWDRFQILSDNPEGAKLFIGERLLKELAEAADIFDNADISASFFKRKFVFLMIPYKGDMFEASNIHIPVATKQHAMQCKREIEQILEIIDVFDLYQKADTPPAEVKNEVEKAENSQPDSSPSQEPPTDSGSKTD